MTPKQRQQKLATIETMLRIFGFTKDIYGNWKNSHQGYDYRIKLKKVNIRIERKSGSTWYKIISKPFNTFPLENLAKWLSKFPII